MKLSFEAWKQLVNRFLVGLSGMHSDDLPDCPYRDWYDRNVNYKDAARRALRRAREL